MLHLRRKRDAAVRGVDLPGPRLTRWAWIYLGLYVALPILALGFLMDLILYLLADRVFGVCYAVLCLF